MLEREIRVSSLVAGGVWVISVALIGCSAALAGQVPRWATALAELGLLCAVVAMTLTVRGFFLAAREREQKCFDVGREVGRAEGGVRSVQ